MIAPLEISLAIVRRLVNFIIQSFRRIDTMYSGVQLFFTTYCINLTALSNYEIDSDKTID